MHVWCSSRPFSSTRTISRAVHGTEIAFLDGVNGSDRGAGDLWTAQDRWGSPAGAWGPAKRPRVSYPKFCGQTADKPQTRARPQNQMFFNKMLI